MAKRIDLIIKKHGKKKKVKKQLEISWISSIKKEIENRNLKIVLSVDHCTPFHFKIRGGEKSLNLWPKNNKVQRDGGEKVLVMRNPADVIDYAIGNLFANGPICIHKAHEQRPLPRSYSSTKTPKTVTQSYVGGPRCHYCKQAITLHHDIEFEDRSMIHKQCRPAKQDAVLKTKLIKQS